MIPGSQMVASCLARKYRPSRRHLSSSSTPRLRADVRGHIFDPLDAANHPSTEEGDPPAIAKPGGRLVVMEELQTARADASTPIRRSRARHISACRNGVPGKTPPIGRSRNSRADDPARMRGVCAFTSIRRRKSCLAKRRRRTSTSGNSGISHASLRVLILTRRALH